jgi:hypothetical protein
MLSHLHQFPSLISFNFKSVSALVMMEHSGLLIIIQ